MTKAEEIKILSAAAKKLGNDSYLGDALSALIPHIEMEIRSDIIPNLLLLIKDMERRAVDADLRYRDISILCTEKEATLKGMNLTLDNMANRRDDLEEEIERAKWKAVDALNALKGMVPDALVSLACK